MTPTAQSLLEKDPPSSVARAELRNVPVLERRPLVEWKTRLEDCGMFCEPGFDDSAWKSVRIPHNWEDYHGYRVQSHGNLHGTAWYRTRFDWRPAGDGERLYAFFEGVGSYAQVFCNGVPLGEHAGGRTTFTVDLTSALQEGQNLLAVRAHHPEDIDDLPFICGGCWGSPNTEGSQPFGMFRPAWLEHTGPVRVTPFGVHVLTPEVSEQWARIESRTELANPGDSQRRVRLRQRILDPAGHSVLEKEIRVALRAGETKLVTAAFPPLSSPKLWCPENPALHRMETAVFADGTESHRTETTFGLRWLEWPPISEPDGDRGIHSPESRGVQISTGEVERSPENNGLVSVLFQKEHAPAVLAPMGAVVHMEEPEVPTVARLSVHLDINGGSGTELDLFCEIQNEGGSIFFHQHRGCVDLNGAKDNHVWKVPPIHHPHKWTPTDPYLHRLLVELRSPEGELWERSETLFGIRKIDAALNLARPVYEKIEHHAPLPDVPPEKRVLRLNCKPLFLNGTCEYEHLLGCDHAFTDEQIAADVAMMHSAGFNAFRDAHHPHNLRYYDHWDRLGIVCWTQMGSHVWFDTPRFRQNYRRLVTEWVRERRNHPCVILWGLQNESALPEDFARELRDLIRELDPSSPAWRLTTTCNGGKGSDWNVPQEWSGTYGGNCTNYDLERLQMVGEYGAWRLFGVHTEVEYRGDENDRSESWACYAMETKIRRGEEARDRAIGHFHWIFNTFANPGRTAENYEGPGNAEIGSVNNKGLVTAWHQPSDLYYLFRANYAEPAKEPMVYIVSHTWPDRWKRPGPRTVRVYSNCEEVELFNGVGVRSLGKRIQPGRGKHFRWEKVEPLTNVLHAVGRIGGREVACDLIALDHLPPDDSLGCWLGPVQDLPPDPGLPIFRVSCGDDEPWTDGAGRSWLADSLWRPGADHGWVSWGARFANVPDDLASRGDTTTPVRGTPLPRLYRNYRYGRHELKYHFRVGPGRYTLRLHFAEPWFGVGGGLDCRGWRMFDIASGNQMLERRFDIWSAAGGDHRALIRQYDVISRDEFLTLHFPFVQVNQAMVSAIEIFQS